MALAELTPAPLDSKLEAGVSKRGLTVISRHMHGKDSAVTIPPESFPAVLAMLGPVIEVPCPLGIGSYRLTPTPDGESIRIEYADAKGNLETRRTVYAGTLGRAIAKMISALEGDSE